MKKMIDFKNWLIENHIKEEWNDLTAVGKTVIFPMWLVRSSLIWLGSPLFLAYYMFINSDTYYKLEGITAEMFIDIINNQQEMMKQFNK